jgi:hypothetical protein
MSTDGKDIKLTFSGHKGESVDVISSMEEFEGMLAFLMEFSTSTNIATTLPLDPKDEKETPVAEHSLLFAKNIDVVRYESGGCALQFQSTSGVSLQLALDKEKTGFLAGAMTSYIHKNES